LSGTGYPSGEISPFGDGDGEKLSPRAGTGAGNGGYILNGDANVPTIPDGDSPVAISSSSKSGKKDEGDRNQESSDDDN
jgi:hypothetical protein